jgi:hypothetical protein
MFRPFRRSQCRERRPCLWHFALCRATGHNISNASLAGCSILICEDESLIALDIANAFTNAGARVLTVRSLAQARPSLS